MKPTSSIPWRSGIDAPLPSAHTQVDPVGVHHDEPVRVGDGVVVRKRGLIGSGGTGGVQVDHQPRRGLNTRGHVHGVGPGHAPEVELGGLRRCRPCPRGKRGE